MEVPQFVQDGQLTPDGLKVKQWMEAQFAEADATNDLHALNGMSGYLANYYLMAFKGNGKGFGMSPEQWFGENRYSGAAAALRDMTYFAEQAAEKAAQAEAVEENTQATSVLAAKIEALAAELTEVKAELEAERAKHAAPAEAAPVPETEPEPKKRGRKAKAEVTEAEETETEDEGATEEDAPDADETNHADSADGDEADSKS